jgi:phosphoglycerate dehydrogenase-like enzyme
VSGGKTAIAILARFGRVPILAALKAMDDVEVLEAETVDQLVSFIPKASVLAMTDPSAADGARIAAALRAPDNKVAWIQALSAGFDGLMRHDLPPSLAITAQGGAVGPPVAEHAIGMLLGLSRGLFEIGIRSRAQDWDRVLDPPIAALEGRTAAIIGFGNIGREVARRLRAFDMRIVAVSRGAPEDGLADDHMPLSDLHAALAQADTVIVTIALADGTRHLFDTAAFAACKPGALLINVARGEIVDQAALKEALDSGRLGGAAIDVTTPEPLPADDPLWQAPRLIVSPHTAGAGSPLAAKRIAGLLTENLRRFGAGEALLHRTR